MKRWQRIALATIVVVLLSVFGIMLHHLNQYDHADRCSSPNTVSRTCIAYVPGKVTKEQKQEEVSSCYNGNCYSHHEYKFVVETQSGKRVTISVGESRKDLRLGDSVELIRWDDEFFGISGHDRQSYLYSWHPLLTRTLLVLSIALLTIIGAFLAWRSLRPKASGPTQETSSNKVWITWIMIYFTLFIALLSGLFMGLLV